MLAPSKFFTTEVMVTLSDPTPRVPVSDRLATLPVVIIGAGPIGLAAAANFAERGIDFTILEAGHDVADSVRSWGHTRLFSTWKHLVDPASVRLLQAADPAWSVPAPERAPSGAELVEAYLLPLSRLTVIASRTRMRTEAIAVSRVGMDRTRSANRAVTPFLVRIRTADGIEELEARAVIDASGTYRTPNSLSSSGLSLLGLEEIADLVQPALPDVLGRDRDLFAGKHTTVVGAGHSAANTLLGLVQLAREVPGTRVTWLIRNRSAVRVSSSPDDELEGRSALGGRVDAAVRRGEVALVDRFEILRARRSGAAAVELVGQRGGELVTHESDLVVNATGFRPDLDVLREIRLDLDEIVQAPDGSPR
ncbi:NAD(P)-binding domain-containing protein [Agromyces seonyuensis]|uniref:NAD(P)-binding domain-containing protein n=1 Tax=Agromyces seonyuensis TaxID=2662446 RepID=UPI001F2241D6|nr:NAD(P)-binding domain-containing protein [Agromyces seonyuensis]